jgi:hypothetical protein
MAKANRGGWKTCPRGHKYRGCWPLSHLLARESQGQSQGFVTVAQDAMWPNPAVNTDCGVSCTDRQPSATSMNAWNGALLGLPLVRRFLYSLAWDTQTSIAAYTCPSCLECTLQIFHMSEGSPLPGWPTPVAPTQAEPRQFAPTGLRTSRRTIGDRTKLCRPTLRSTRTSPGAASLAPARPVT